MTKQSQNRSILVLIMGCLLLMFQNCSNADVTFSKIGSGKSISMPVDTGVVVTDEQGNIESVVSSSESESNQIDTHTSSTETHGVVVDSIGSCIDLAKNYKNAIDISQFSNMSTISLLNGSNFIYSSTGQNILNSLKIEKTHGRTIICGLVINQIDFQSGRLDLLRATRIENVIHLNGTVKMESDCSINRK